MVKDTRKERAQILAILAESGEITYEALVQNLRDAGLYEQIYLLPDMYRRKETKQTVRNTPDGPVLFVKVGENG